MSTKDTFMCNAERTQAADMLHAHWDGTDRLSDAEITRAVRHLSKLEIVRMADSREPHIRLRPAAIHG